MRILLFGGFLGSGKTTTILQVAKYLTGVCKETVAIIENEIGAAGMDDKILSASGLRVRNLFGGCVCCQITSELIQAITEIHETVEPDWLIIEMTGLAFPSKTAGEIEKYSKVHSAFKTVTLVDRGRWKEVRSMLEVLVVGQVTGSDLVLINKADLHGEDLLNIMQDLTKIDAKIKVMVTSAVQEMPPALLQEVVCCGE
ncbi:MAG TPA: GTP-binding protein [Patescibacteria group bacterium]|nr:GTP-binding protein [Patescibacteria group bacterium]